MQYSFTVKDKLIVCKRGQDSSVQPFRRTHRKPALDLIHQTIERLLQREFVWSLPGKQAEPYREKIVCLDGRVMDAEVSGSFIIYKG